jgi:hypothetical protein
MSDSMSDSKTNKHSSLFDRLTLLNRDLSGRIQSLDSQIEKILTIRSEKLNSLMGKTDYDDGLSDFDLASEMADAYSSEPFSLEDSTFFKGDKGTLGKEEIEKNDVYIPTSAALKRNKVSKPDLEELLDKAIVQEFLFHGKQLVTSYKLPNGFCVIGVSAVIDPRNFNLSLGRVYCREEAINKLWEFQGYLLQEKIHERSSHL